jgi:hypothetical protein
VFFAAGSTLDAQMFPWFSVRGTQYRISKYLQVVLLKSAFRLISIFYFFVTRFLYILKHNMTTTYFICPENAWKLNLYSETNELAFMTPREVLGHCITDSA